MDISTFKFLAPKLPAKDAILMRGPTGIGKSFLAADLAKVLDLPLIDVRGSTMDESKVTGIPDFIASKEHGVATFVLPSWFVRACKEPCVILLDEINRSMPQVMQAFFQVVLDRSLGNDAGGMPMTLHPDSRVVACGNFGSEYDVTQMDPALLRRFWTQDIECTTEDWIIWAKGKCDPLLIDFIRQNPIHLRVDPAGQDSDKVLPTPASWHKLDGALTGIDGWAPSKLAGLARPDHFYGLCAGYIGTEATISFCEFITKYERVITAKMVLAGEVGKDKVDAMKASESMVVIERLVEHNLDNDWDETETGHICDFIHACPEEQLIHLWNELMSSKRMVNIVPLHKLGMGDEVIEIIAKAAAVAA